MAWIFGLLKGLAVFGRLGWLFSWLPASLAFLGPVGPFLGAVVGFVGEIIKWFFDGLTIILSKPVTLVTVALLGTVAWGFGLDFGLRWDKHKIEVRDAKIAGMQKAQKDRDDDEAKRAAAAKAARQKAESEVAKAPTIAAPAAPAATPASERVRVKRPAKPVDQPSLFGILTNTK